MNWNENASDVFQGEKLLLVDDNALNLKVMKMLLEEKGLCVDTALSGAEALNYYLASEEYHYFIILVDINMAGMDGYKVTQKIRESERQDCKSVKIYAISANIAEQFKKRAKKAGMNGYITKPVIYEDLYELFHTIIEQENQ